jgi:hypothetical protein
MPDEATCDRLEAQLGSLHDAVDGVHDKLFRAGLARMDGSKSAGSTEHLDPHWVYKLRELEGELERTAQAVREELDRIA